MEKLTATKFEENRFAFTYTFFTKVFLKYLHSSTDFGTQMVVLGGTGFLSFQRGDLCF